MPRPASGYVEYRPGRDGEPGKWWARITCADGSRPWIPLKGKWPNTKRGKERAKEAARAKTEQFRERGIVGVPLRGAKARALRKEHGDWWDRFFNHRRDLGMRDVRGSFTTHVEPVIGRPDPGKVTVEHVRKLRRHLDSQVQANRIAWKTAFNAWALFTVAMKAACGAWNRDKDGERFKVRDDNPAAGVSPPDRGDPKQLQFLYPDELLALLGCDGVPIEWRRIYACSVYLYVRAGELRALRWEDVDLDHGVVSVRYSYDQDTKTTKQTKTGNKGVRRFAIEPNLLPLLRAMRREAGEEPAGPLFTLPDRKHWAEQLREHLMLAEVKRTELHESDQTTKRLRFHDLRSTALTWAALRGDEPLKIQNRAGHRTFEMTQVYIRTAENLRDSGDAIGEPFPPLPGCLTGSGTATPTNGAPGSGAGRNADRSLDDIPTQDFVQSELSVRNDCGGAGNRTRVRKASAQSSFTCVASLPKRRGCPNSAGHLALPVSRPHGGEHSMGSSPGGLAPLRY